MPFKYKKIISFLIVIVVGFSVWAVENSGKSNQQSNLPTGK